MPKNNTVIKVHMDDSFITDIIDERDRALARNRSLEEMVETQDQDLQAASTTIKALVGNAQGALQHLQSEVATLKQLITDAYNVHFGYGKDMGNDEWMSLSVSTLDDMRAIAERGGQS